jgi:hypothetical protein
MDRWWQAKNFSIFQNISSVVGNAAIKFSNSDNTNYQ